MPVKSDSYYSGSLYQDYSTVVDHCIKLLKPVEDEFDGLVATGLSGGTLIATVATLMGKKWAVVRKSDAVSHSSNRFEGTIGDRWVFIDDFISSGASLIRCIQAINYKYRQLHDWEDYRGPKPVFVGCVLYAGYPKLLWRNAMSREMPFAWCAIESHLDL